MTTSEREDGHGVERKATRAGGGRRTVSLRGAARLQSTKEDHASRTEALHLPDKGHGPEESRGRQEKRWVRVTEGGESLLSLRACALGLVLSWGPEHRGGMASLRKGHRTLVFSWKQVPAELRGARLEGEGDGTRSSWLVCGPAEATQCALGRAEVGVGGTCPGRGRRRAPVQPGVGGRQQRRLEQAQSREPQGGSGIFSAKSTGWGRRASPFPTGETPWLENKSHSPLIKAAAWHVVFEDFGFIQKPHENLVSCFSPFPRAASQELPKSGGRMTPELDSLAALEARSPMAKCRTFPASGGNKPSPALLPASGVWAILGVTVRPGGRPDPLTWSLTAALAS